MTANRNLEHLHRLVGTWTTELTHRLMPGVVVRGTTTCEWLDGERFLIVRARTEHPDFPISMAVLGITGEDRAAEDGTAHPDPAAPLTMHSYDSRGVFRAFESTIDDRTWQFSRLTPGFSQRFVGTFADGGGTIHGVAQLSEDDTTWVDDLSITYRRAT